MSRSVDDDAIVGRIRDIEISFFLIDVEIFGISESGRRSGTSFQGVEVGLAKNNLGGNSSGGLLADKVVPQHATGSTVSVSELIRIKDVQGIVGCVIDDCLRTRQVEKADVVRRVPGNEVSGADDFDGTGGFAGEVGDRRIIVLEDATETVVNDPESVERVNIGRVRIAEGSSLDDATGMRGSAPGTNSNSESGAFDDVSGR